jgi:hypothetical protein
LFAVVTSGADHAEAIESAVATESSASHPLVFGIVLSAEETLHYLHDVVLDRSDLGLSQRSRHLCVCVEKQLQFQISHHSLTFDLFRLDGSINFSHFDLITSNAFEIILFL